MSVATYTAPNYTTQSSAQYKANIDGDFSVLAGVAQMFAPHAKATPDMTVQVDAGALFYNGTLAVQSLQTSGTITAPVGNPRIDRVVIDALTGAMSIVTGTPAGSPTPPAIPAGKLPCAQILLQTSSATITNSMITDERTHLITSLVPTIGNFTRDISVASGTTTFAHGTGVAPKAVVFFGSSAGVAGSWGAGLVGGVVGMLYTRADDGLKRSTTSAAVGFFVDASNFQYGSPSSADATNVTMTWTKTGAPTGTLTVDWIAFF